LKGVVFPNSNEKKVGKCRGDQIGVGLLSLAGASEAKKWGRENPRTRNRPAFS